MTLMEIVILALCVQRLVTIWLLDKVTEIPRVWLQARKGWIGYLAGCPMCLSVWFAGAALGLWQYGGTAGRIVVGILAVADGALILDTMIGTFGRIARADEKRVVAERKETIGGDDVVT